MYKYLIFYLMTHMSMAEDPARVVQQNIFIGNLSDLANYLPNAIKFIEINQNSNFFADSEKNSLDKMIGVKPVITEPSRNLADKSSSTNQSKEENNIAHTADNNHIKSEEITPISERNQLQPENVTQKLVKNGSKNLFELLVEEAGLIDDEGNIQEKPPKRNLKINRSKLYKIAEILKSDNQPKDDTEPTYVYKTNNSPKKNKTTITI